MNEDLGHDGWMTSQTSQHTDIRDQHFVYRLTPSAVWPYLSLMRLDRPIGTWLLLLPAWWVMAMEAGGIGEMSFHHVYLFILFALGAIIMRGAGCVINDLWDRDIDAAVERTRGRPLASGQVSVRNAVFFTAGLCLVGLIILLQLTGMAIVLGVLSLFPVILYPLAKRVTWYPQAVLGLTFNFGALIGSAAILNSVSVPAVILYIGGFFWTLGYDTIYAHQDIADDGIVGVKSTARKFGEKSPVYISFFYSIFAVCLYVIGFITEVSLLFYIFWALAGLQLVWQVYDWDMDEPMDCLKKFRSNKDFGFLVLAAFLLGYLPLT